MVDQLGRARGVGGGGGREGLSDSQQRDKGQIAQGEPVVVTQQCSLASAAEARAAWLALDAPRRAASGAPRSLAVAAVGDDHAQLAGGAVRLVLHARLEPAGGADAHLRAVVKSDKPCATLQRCIACLPACLPACILACLSATASCSCSRHWPAQLPPSRPEQLTISPAWSNFPLGAAVTVVAKTKSPSRPSTQ